MAWARWIGTIASTAFNSTTSRRATSMSSRASPIATAAWTVSAFDDLSFDALAQGFTPVDGGFTLDGGAAVVTPTLKFSFDKTSGANGDTIKMTITVLRKDVRYGATGAEPFYVVSKLGTESRYYIGLVGN